MRLVIEHTDFSMTITSQDLISTEMEIPVTLSVLENRPSLHDATLNLRLQCVCSPRAAIQRDPYLERGSGEKSGEADKAGKPKLVFPAIEPSFWPTETLSRHSRGIRPRTPTSVQVLILSDFDFQ